MKNCLAHSPQLAYRFHSGDFKSVSFGLLVFAPPDFCESPPSFATSQGHRLLATDLREVALFNEEKLEAQGELLGRSASN